MVYTCGLRPLEGRCLKKQNIDLSSGEVVIECSKERKSRIVVMSDDMTALASRYAEHLQIAVPESEYFFPKEKSTIWSSSHFQSYFMRAFRLSHPEIPEEFLPRVRVYDLRHRFATAAIHRWLEQGTNLASRLPYLQMYMGHASLSSTLYYVHMLPEHLVKAAGVDWESLGKVFPGAELWQE